MLGVDGPDYAVHQSSDGWVPVYADDSEARMACMSVGFLVKRKSDSVVWRGPKKNAMIRQFLKDVRWGELDYLIIDTPPGTSDEHLSLIEHLSSALQSLGPTQLPTNPLHISAILVTTPQAVALSDAIKSLSFARTVAIPSAPGSTELKPLPMLGIIENMSGYACPCCGEVTNVFSKGGGEDMAKKEGVQFLGRLPIDTELVDLLDDPRGVKEKENSGETRALEARKGFWLLEKYRRTPTFKVFEGIAQSIVDILNMGYPTSSSSANVTEAVH
ncbi:cytosolic Fe-S cluster assembly factor cfd1 [Tulasnella sp. 419]|nr:cytosolic Fe-S cluster assembly factor cfd1 [Tulasnella sp. 419]